VIKKPKRLRVAGSDALLSFFTVGKDAIFTGRHSDVTVCLNRQTLEPTWEVESGQFSVGQLVGDTIIANGGAVSPACEAPKMAGSSGRSLAQV
jgi:hypothetical protein